MTTILDHAIEVAEFVDAVNRFLRVERGRRTEKLTKWSSKGRADLTGHEKNRRSEEMLVARFVDGTLGRIILKFTHHQPSA